MRIQTLTTFRCHAWFILFTVIALLIGCSSLPESSPYARPAAPVPATWPTTATVDAPPVTPSLDWKTVFPDPCLQSLIETALTQNRDLQSATARVEEARALYGQASAARIPDVGVGLSENASRTPASVSSSGAVLDTRRLDFNLNLLSFELDFWGRVKALEDAAKASFLATTYAQHAFRLSLINDVANAYLSQRELGERIALGRATLAGREQTRELLRRRAEVGLANELDVLTTSGAIDLARADLAALRRQQSATENALLLLVGGSERVPLPICGQAHAGTQEPSVNNNTKRNERVVVATIPAGLPSEVLLNRPDVLAAEQRLRAAHANIHAARAAFLPTISLTAGLGVASKLLINLFEGGNGAWNFQPMIRYPLFNDSREATLNLAEARQRIAIVDYEKTIQQAFREVADLLTARTALIEELDARQASEQTQMKRLELVRARLKQGVANMLEVLDAERDLYTAQQIRVQIQRLLLATNASIYKALGSDTQGVASS